MQSRRVFGIFIFFGAMVVFGLVIFSPWWNERVEAATAAGVIITNIIQVDWNSGTVAMSTNSTNTISQGVGTNYGMVWIGIADQKVVSGASISNDTILSNEGNATADFILTFNTNVYANANTLNWTAVFTNVTSGGASSSTLVVTLPPASWANIWLLVSVPAGETNGAFITFQCLASNSNATAEIGAGATNYVGYNGIVYGGDMGLYGAPPGNAFLSNANTEFTNWVVTAIFADIVVTKTADISNAGPFVADTTTPFPGAIITYRLGFTNQGRANGTSVRITDSIPTNYLTYVLGSLRTGSYGSTFADYGTLSPLTDDEGDDQGSTNSTAADQIVFCPTNGTAPGTGGTVNSNDGGAYYYRTYLQ